MMKSMTHSADETQPRERGSSHGGTIFAPKKTRTQGQESPDGPGHAVGAQRVIPCGWGSVPGQRLSKTETARNGPEGS